MSKKKAYAPTTDELNDAIEDFLHEVSLLHIPVHWHIEKVSDYTLLHVSGYAFLQVFMLYVFVCWKLTSYVVVSENRIQKRPMIRFERAWPNYTQHGSFQNVV